LADLFIEEKSDGARRRLREADAGIHEAEAKLRDLQAHRDRLTSKTVARKLEALRAALSREPIDIVEINRAIREAVNRIELKPDQGCLTIYWQHAEDPSTPIVFGERHMKWENP
jgi:ATP-dependent exoDNAse (exonuclease V) alpha subunit